MPEDGLSWRPFSSAPPPNPPTPPTRAAATMKAANFAPPRGFCSLVFAPSPCVPYAAPPSVLEVGDRSGRMGEVVDVDQLESELLGHDAHGAVRESALHVSRGLEVLLGELLDLGEVVVLRAHPQPQLGVRAPRLLRCGDGLAFATLQLPVQAEDRFDGLVAHALGHAHGRDAELAEDGALLRAFQGDLESGTAVRRLPGDEIGHLRLGRLGDRLQQRELGLALAVLDQAQLRTGDADESTELVERESVLQPVVTDAVAESREVDAGGRHSLSLAKEFKFLSLEMAESRARIGRT